MAGSLFKIGPLLFYKDVEWSKFVLLNDIFAARIHPDQNSNWFFVLLNRTETS